MNTRQILGWTLALWGLFLALMVLSGCLWGLMAWFHDVHGAPVARVLTLFFGLAAAACQALLTALLTLRELQRSPATADRLGPTATSDASEAR